MIMRASSPGPAIPARWAAKVQVPADGIALSTGMFSRTVRITRRRYASTPAVRRYPRPDSSVNRRSSGSAQRRSNSRFSSRGSDSGNGFYGCGSDATDAVQPGHTPYQSAYRSLSAGSDRLHLCDTAGDFFGNDCRSSSGGVYPAAPPQMVFSRSRLLSFSCRKAWISASLFGVRYCFSRKMSSEEIRSCFPVFYRACSVISSG